MASVLFGVREGGSTRATMPEGLVLSGLRWTSPPVQVADLLIDRGTKRLVETWLLEWANAISSGDRLVEVARAARSVSDTRAASFSYGPRDHRVTWKRVGLPTVQGGTLWIDLGSSAQMTDRLRDAVNARYIGDGPRSWSEWVEWANGRGRLFTQGAEWAGARAIAGLHAVGTWYRDENARALAARRNEEAAAAAAAAEDEAQARREWERQTPERIAKMRRALDRTFADTRALARLQQKAPDLGRAGVVTVFRAAAEAAEAAEAAGGTEAEQDAAAAAVIDETLSALDLLYPVASPDYYVATFGTLSVEWQALFLAAAYADDATTAGLPVAPPTYYLETYAELAPEWANLFQQLARTPEE